MSPMQSEGFKALKGSNYIALFLWATISSLVPIFCCSVDRENKFKNTILEW